MAIFFITYGDKYFEQSKIRICKEAKKFGFDRILCFSPKDLTDEFIGKTKDFIQEKRGAGYWLWKPFILFNVFNIMQSDDIIVYLDAGCSINVNGKDRFKEYIRFMDSNNGVFSFHLPGKKESDYTKTPVFNFFDIDADDDIFKSEQLIATILIFRKNNFTTKLINDFYQVAIRRPDLFTDKNSLSTQPTFVGHRHDQSIFSVMRKKLKIKSIEDESYFQDWNNPKVKNIPFLSKRIRDQKPSWLKRQIIKIILKFQLHVEKQPLGLNN